MLLSPSPSLGVARKPEMLQQTKEVQLHCTSEKDMLLPEKPVSLKKIALRELHNENVINIPNSAENSKDRATELESGTKGLLLDCPVSLSCNQSPSSNSGHLVYVRRKLEGDVGKTSMSDGRHSRQVAQAEEPKNSSFAAIPPQPRTLMNSSTKTSVEMSMSNSPVSPDPNGMKNLHWEERYHCLQMLLKKLDASDQKDYIRSMSMCLKVLRSLSSVELSGHAVELEKRSIQLSLEEGKEVQRVAALNVLGKSMKSIKALSTHLD